MASPRLQPLASRRSPRRFRIASNAFACFVAATGLSRAADSAPEPLAILQKQCLRCHTEEKRKGGLLLTGRESLLAGGDSGPVVEPGHSGGSLLVDVLFPESDSHMPPKGQLTPAEIVTLETWIDEGLPWDQARWDQLRLSPFDGPVQLARQPSTYRPVFGIALSPDGRHLAAGRGNRIEWFEVATVEAGKDPADAGSWLAAGRDPSEAGLDTIQSLAWSPSGDRVVSGSFRRIAFWDPRTGRETGEITTDLAGRISALAFTPDGKTLLAADSLDATAGRLLVIDAESGALSRVLPAHDDTIFSIAVSPDGRLAATTSADKSAKVWNLADGSLVHHLEGHTDYVLAAAFSPQSDRLATAGDDEEVKIWRLETGKKVSSFGGKLTGPITALAWTVDPAREKQKAEEKDPEKAAAINTDRIVALNEAGQPRIYTDLNEHEGEQRSTGAKEKTAEATSIGLAALAFDPISGRFFAGSTQGVISAWDEAGKLLAEDDPTAAVAQATP